MAELKRHEKTINVVRFSPDGNYIATGGDGKEKQLNYGRSIRLVCIIFACFF